MPQQPPFSRVESYQPVPHPDALPKALQVLKELKGNGAIWRKAQVKDNVKLQQYKQQGDVIPTVRGDGSIEGWSMEELLATIRYQECRAVWDVGHEKGVVMEMYDRHTSCFWNSQKGEGWIVWPRDFVGMTGNVQEGATTYYFNVSVPMENVPKLKASHVRGSLDVAGFVLHQAAPNKIDLTYIVKVDPAGSIPAILVAGVTVDIPLAIAQIRKYLGKHGFPPYLPVHSEPFHGILQLESYDRKTDTLELRWRPEGAGSFNVYYDKKMWRNGARVVMGGNTSENDIKVSSGEGKVTIGFEEGAKGKNLQVFVKAA